MAAEPAHREPSGRRVGAAVRRGRGDLGRLRRAVRGALAVTWQASRRGFLLGCALQAVGALAAAALVVLGQRAIEALVGPRGVDADGVLLLIVGLAAATAILSAATSLQQQQQRLLAEQVSAVAWRRVLDVTGTVELERYETPGFFDRLERVRTSAVTRPVAVTTAVFGVLGGAAGTVALIVVLVGVDPLLVLVLALGGVPAVLAARKVSALEFGFVADAMPLFRGRDYLRLVLTGRDEAKEVRAFGAAGVLRDRHDERSGLFLRDLRRHVRRRQCYTLAAVAATTVALASSLALLVWLLSQGRITIADAGAGALGVRLLSSRLDATFQSVGGLLESAVFLDDLDGFLALASAGPPRSGGAAPTLDRALRLDRVCYAYPGSDRPVLRDVSLTIGAGEVVAIVGENGSGKTTLAKVIAGLYAPTAGEITWDGVDATASGPLDIRRGVAVIFQDFVRYQLSALDNIGLGQPAGIGDVDAARAAARRARAAGFLEALPAGYATVLSKEYAGGTDLSLGQWQRVALARALRRDAPLVILDEPSSALDPRAEQALFADVRNMIDGRAALLISHRYSTVRTADRIFVMRDGRVVETGTHDSLMDAGGLYAELFTMQAEAYR